ncbi:TRAP transporter small permease [Ideonella sp. DXS22W]|uniref:TRAP transporter small permease protein n=1 Tax=Pseudaquabacterium inlustre TaxID=2984192 RepID=A0ABU9CGI4_9BURK
MAELNPVAEPSHAPTPVGGVPRWLDRLITGWGLAGGVLFCAIVAMSIVSILGRKLLASPIQGDMELLQMGAAIGSAAFLPLCELYDHHIKVDALTTWMSERGRAVLDTLAHTLLLGVALLLTWRTALYMLEAHENQEVSTLLLVPLWQPVALLVPSFVLLALAALSRVNASLRVAVKGAAA